MANPKLFRTIDKAVSEYNMIEEDDRILIAASGGKDSTALTEYFAARLQRRHPVFEAAALHIATDIGSEFAPELAERFKSWGIELSIKTISVLERLKTGKKMNCWWCSSQRRLELSTALMNALTKGELAAMPPVLKFDKFPVTFIRPLCLADIPMIIRHAEMQGYISSTCTCSYQDNSGRKTARSRLDKLTDGNYELKRKLFDALRNINAAYLP